jgi:hypothetical protein
MSIIPKSTRQRQARPGRKQFDAEHWDRVNLREARRILNDSDSPAGLREWAKLFVERLEREGDRS